jgi:ribonuclease E
MTKKMLIDATHAEETRVVVLDGNRLEEYDVETSTKKQLKGNIYLAKVVRVEPSLQAAFVEYGGNRHGFLAFSEIHPDYYQIPVADRERLIALQEEEARAAEAEDEAADAVLDAGHQAGRHAAAPLSVEQPAGSAMFEFTETGDVVGDRDAEIAPLIEVAAEPVAGSLEASLEDALSLGADTAPEANAAELGPDASDIFDTVETVANDAPPPEMLGGGDDTGEEMRPRRENPRFMRNYKIQEVIRRRQILLIQVVKEERGNKGAALTTYISLAGRYSVLMPNSPRGGGISRKITSGADRKRLREVAQELDIPKGMGLIIRTAGAARPKPEIKRDGEYLLRLWDDIRELTMKSSAPSLIYEEASLIKRAIRDVYSRDLDEILVDGEMGWRSARDFMRMLMPSHARKVMMWKDPTQSLFARHQVEAQLDAMLSPTVQLRSGGYLVINQTEALVAIDVNSGRATRERDISDTAIRTNLEAVDEVARQLRLRDLAGLIVIDLIDMESKKHNSQVERRLKDALKNDRARIQLGHISHFGLMEMSRQRLRPSLAETSSVVCSHCGGTGQVRSTESAALHVLRAVEEEGSKRRSAEIIVHVAATVALYILNHKRDRLTDIELRCAMKVTFLPDDTLLPPNNRIERLRAYAVGEAPPLPSQIEASVIEAEVEELDIEDLDVDVAGNELDVDVEVRFERAAAPPRKAQQEKAAPDKAPSDKAPVAAETEALDGAAVAASAEETEKRRRRRRRRRRRGGRDDQNAVQTEGSAMMVRRAMKIRVIKIRRT